MSNKVAVVCGNAKVSDFVTADCNSEIPQSLALRSIASWLAIAGGFVVH